VALVTGASYGIGGAAALAFADSGYDLAIAARQIDSLEDTAARVEATGRRALRVALDLTDQGSVEAAMAAVLAEFGHVDTLINNAGRPLRKPALEVTREDWNAVVEVNLTGTFFMLQQMGSQLIASGREGCIINVASTTGLVGRPLSSTYGTSKAGIIQMTRMLAIEWAPHGIRVNAIAPASTVTPTRTSLTDPARRDAFLSKIPLGRFGTPGEMAAAMVYLASPVASFITGQTLVLDGGLTAC
jgi:NAD(P)-dependent dehydrogenase (short-subunit alcohol dehydrogenase family)